MIDTDKLTKNPRAIESMKHTSLTMMKCFKIEVLCIIQG